MVQDTDKQNKQDVKAETKTPQKDGNSVSTKSREDYTNLKGIFYAKAVAQLIFGAGVLHAAYSDFNLLPTSALIYLTGTLFDLIIATSMNKGPKCKTVLIISRIFEWINIAFVGIMFFIVLYKIDIGACPKSVFWTIGIVIICLGIMSSVMELILNRPNDD